MLIAALPSASATSATTPGPVRDRDAQLVRCRRRRGRPRAAGGGRRARRRSRRRSRRASPSASAARTAPSRADRVVDRLDQRVGVREVDVAPDRRVGAGDAGDVAEARAGRRQRLALFRARARGLRDEHVGEHVRQVRDRREHAVVGLGVERRGAGAEAGEQPVQALVERAAGVSVVGVRYQVAPSNSSARAWRTPAFAAPASGWPPMKRSSSTASTTVRLVEPTSVTTQSSPAAASAARDRRRERADGRGDERRLGAVERRRDVRRGTVDGADLERGVERAGRRVEADDLGAQPLARGEPDRPADQPDADDGDPHRATGFTRRSRAPCRRPPRRARPSRRTRRSRPRAAAAGRRRSPRRAPGGPRR